MSADKSKAAMLADKLDRWARSGFWDEEAAAELRRLDASEAALIEALRIIIDNNDELHFYEVASAALARAKEARNG